VEGVYLESGSDERELFSFAVLTVSLLLKDQSIICTNSSSKKPGEF